MEKADKSYTAANIRVLTDAEIVERFDWAKLGHLAAHYRRDPAFIRRGIRACETVGVPASYFVKRYLDGDKTIPFREDVDAAFTEMLRCHEVDA